MKIKIISPYFLKENASLPKHFQLYLNSCGKNPEYEWLFISNADMEQYQVPQNVVIVKQEFEAFREFVQSKFDFPISLENPYKLCDYKVLYGYIFAEYLEGFDFWGYADSTDLIWGKLSDFITEDVLRQYDKIYTKGHLTLYRNKKEYVECFLNYEKDGITYKDALESRESWATDETGKININTAWREIGYSEYVQESDIADLSPLHFEFRMAMQLPSGKILEENNKNRVFEWQKGKLYGYYVQEDEVIKEEFAYLHFQKRNMKLNVDTETLKDHFFVRPNEFVDNLSIKADEIKKVTRHKSFYIQFFLLKYKGLKAKIKRRIAHG